MKMDDLLQWIALGAILLIIIVWITRRIIRFRRALTRRDGSGCGCGCDGCDKYCQLADKNPRDDGK
ncbi:MAG: FeoB-associated Cys-rich membrane protein [Bacteroidales bacterium]|nr:FeoB-associated Cys-rich membrane protein [Bacteroidales bacterium]